MRSVFATHSKAGSAPVQKASLVSYRNLQRRVIGLQRKLTINKPGDIYEREADDVADQVMRMPDPGRSVHKKSDENAIHRKCAKCEEEEKKLHRKESPGSVSGQNAPPIIDEVLQSPGQPLDRETRSFMEPRFGYDFGNVRIHTDEKAQDSARAVNALAYTVGNNVVFGSGHYRPSSAEGERLMAHELTHVVQQSMTSLASIQRYTGCSSVQDDSVSSDHDNAIQMLNIAIGKVGMYDGTAPPEVKKALAKHFHGAVSSTFGAWINLNLKLLLGAMDDSYECFSGGPVESTWACKSPNELATTFWCVPGVDIRLCPPYFNRSDIERSTTLIHEWVHKFGCNFDLGYEFESDYGSNWTLTQLLNADSFSNFVRDVQ